jgi:hypothetical protein
VRENVEKHGLLAFLGLYQTLSNDGFIGAILVTDAQGIPKEFRCTHPVKPTSIQKPLYGDALEPYIGVNLCGVPLFKSIQNSPDLIVVDKDHLLGIRKSNFCPVVSVCRAGKAADVGSVGRSGNNSKREKIDSSTGHFQPIEYATHPNFADDTTVARDLLKKIFVYLDPIEPFDRMKKAIETLGKQDNRFI